MAASRRLPAGRGTGRTVAPRPLLDFAVAVAIGDGARTARAARAARAAGIPRGAVEEVGLMLMLYAGYPAALEALRSLGRVWPGSPRGTRDAGPAERRRRGLALSRRVYGPVHDRLLQAVRALHPDLAAWMVDEGYGRVLARRGLGVGPREHVTVAVLAATRRERQLVSHLRGAARVGVPLAEIRRAVRAGAAAGRGRVPARRAWRAAFGAALTWPSGRP